MERKYTVVLALVCVIIGEAIYIGVQCKLSKSDWASWVQAVGSIAAIGAAILVSYIQNKNSENRELRHQREEIDGLLRSIRCEVQVLTSVADAHAGNTLRSLQPGQGFLVTFPISDNPFKIYDALAPRLGVISSNEIRIQIVKAYALANSMTTSFKLNNAMVVNFHLAQEQAHRSGVPVANDVIVNFHLAALKDYGDGLRSLYERTMAEFALLQTMLPEV